jgi:hypothetical protein
MTPAGRIEKAFDDTHVVIADYLQPGPRNCEETLDQLIRILDRRELCEEVVELLKAEGKEPTLAAYLKEERGPGSFRPRRTPRIDLTGSLLRLGPFGMMLVRK